MARIRAIKPEFWSSPNHPVSPWARLLYIAMWNWADDAGVGTANLRELAGFVFPNDLQITPDCGTHNEVSAQCADSAPCVRRLCAEVSAHYGALFYTVGARPYYAIPTWRDHQKFDSRRGGRHPGMEAAETWLYQEERNESAQCADSAPTVRRHVGASTAPEQGNRGTGEQGKDDDSPSESYDRERAKRESSSTFADGTPIPDEPPADHAPERALDVALVPPTEIGTAATPKLRRAEPAHKSTVRLVLGDAGYPDSTIQQLAVQVARLAGKHPPDLIADALREWDRRPDVKPQFLASVLGDLVKARRARPTAPKSTTDERMAAVQALKHQTPNEQRRLG